MSHWNYLNLTFSNHFCPFKTDLSVNTVWPHALVFPKKRPNWNIFGILCMYLGKHSSFGHKVVLILKYLIVVLARQSIRCFRIVPTVWCHGSVTIKCNNVMFHCVFIFFSILHPYPVKVNWQIDLWSFRRRFASAPCWSQTTHDDDM